MQGAYPWLIRKNAYDVFQKLKPDLSNLSEVVTNEAMNEDIVATVKKMKEFAKNLSTEAKSSCNDGQEDLLTKCKSGGLSINDPVQRVCTLVVAQLAMNEGALPNMLIYEIMQNRVYKQYDEIFGPLLNFKSQSRKSSNATASNGTVSSLVKECLDTNGFLRSKKKKAAKAASCLIGRGEYCLDGKCQTVNRYTFLNSEGGFIAALAGQGGASQTSNRGIPGAIEKLIRHDICGQNSRTDKSVCDSVDIPSKPAGIVE
jgi:hypothetical protein